jgi:2-polyprenyl-3-methyl-5-hydroxy-6-metoxy-1,4-benzoquinol methylase
MPNGNLYRGLAWCYEFITTGRGHKKEADFIRKIVKKYKKSNGNELLDVCCGHGWHDKFLKKWFKITGIDYSNTILKFSKKKNPEILYKQGDMRKFNLKKKFDVVMSFDAMAYNLNYKDLKRTIKNLVNHLKEDGILIFHMDRLRENFKQFGIISNPEGHQFLKGNIYLTYFQIDYDKNSRDTTFESTLVFMVAKKGKTMKIKIDIEKMGLFELSKIKKILSDLDLKTYLYGGDFSYDKYSKKSQFPVFVCVRK